MPAQYILAQELVERYGIQHPALMNRARKIGIRPRRSDNNSRLIVFTSQQAERLDRLNEFMKKNRNISAFLLLENRTADGIPSVKYESVEPTVWDIDEDKVDELPLCDKDDFNEVEAGSVLSGQSTFNPGEAEFIAPPQSDGTTYPPGVEKQLEIWFAMGDRYAPFIFDIFWKNGCCLSTEQIEELVDETPQGNYYQYDDFVFTKVQETSTTGRWRVNKIKLGSPRSLRVPGDNLEINERSTTEQEQPLKVPYQIAETDLPNEIAPFPVTPEESQARKLTYLVRKQKDIFKTVDVS